MMKRRRLTESFEMALVVEPNIDIITDNMISEWGGTPYSELSVLLAHLEYLKKVHHTHHWISRSDSFFGDHELFSRLYQTVEGEIDMVAEKAIGMGSSINVDLSLVTSQCFKMVQGYGATSTIPQTSDLARRSYQAEMTFLKTTSRLVDSLKETGRLTRGVDNMIAGIEDKHESHVYLLKQRCLS
jgi:DNA-binding ferritin-like protein